MTTRRILASLCVMFATALLACSQAARTIDTTDSIDVRPPAATVQTGGTLSFTAAASVEVDWSIREGPSGGAVSAAGFYTAPSAPGVFHVVATSRADPTRSGSATVTVNAPGTGEVVAFPGAEGFGARATGGRGGQVIKVTNLNASGPGSLQAALNVNAPRIVVFAVSGVITGNIVIPYGDLTIAGQTAPGAGITIHGSLKADYGAGISNVIVRHLRVRIPQCGVGCNATQWDAIQFSGFASRIILDHISVAQGADETIDVYEADDVTVQWSTIEASQDAPSNPEPTHNYGLIHGEQSSRISFHHNLCAHHYKRCPAIANGPADVVNNVVYNVYLAFVHDNPAAGNFNVFGNYFKDGPSGRQMQPVYLDDENGGSDTRYYTMDNWADDASAGVNRRIDNFWTDNYWGADIIASGSLRVATPFDFSSYPGYVPITSESSTSALSSVLARSGAFPRDGFTLQTVTEVETRTGAWNPTLPADLMAGLSPTAPPPDADNDGMADVWELDRGLSPTNGNDHSTVLPSGYTAIEEYVNELADQLLW